MNMIWYGCAPRGLRGCRLVCRRYKGPCQDGRCGTEGTQLHDGAFLAVGAAAAAADTLLIPVPVPVHIPLVVMTVAGAGAVVGGGYGPAARQDRSC